MKPQPDPKQDEIKGIFDSLAPRYDIFNRLTSVGLDGVWRRKILKGIKPGSRVLDLGCGTGDLCLAIAKKIRTDGYTVGLDFSESMLLIARKRYERMGCPANGHFELVQKSAEELPLKTGPFDLVVSGFVLRNIYEHIDPILAGVHASLKNNGEIRFLDFTEPAGRLRRALWHFYMNTVAEFYGKLLFGKRFPTGYMSQSAVRFAKPDSFVEKLRRIGFRQIEVRRFMMGSIVLYTAKKSEGV